MAVVSRYFANLNQSTFQQEVDYFINRLVGENRFISVSTWRDPWPNPSGDRFCIYGYVWFREAGDKRIEEEFPDIAQLTFVSDEVIAKSPELADINSLPPLTISSEKH